MARGIDTYKGLGLPVYGSANMKQVGIADMLTLTLSSESTSPGHFLVGRDLISSVDGGFNSLGPDTTAQTADVFSIDVAGGYRATSGTAIKTEFNSSGLFANEYQDTTLGARIVGFTRDVTTISSGTTIYSPVSTESGTLFVFVGTVAERQLALPKNPARGTVFDVVMESSQAVSSDIIITSSLDSSADIWMVNVGDGLLSTVQAIMPSTESGAHVRLTAISSVRWVAEAPVYLASSYTSAVFTTNTFGNLWSSATSIG